MSARRAKALLAAALLPPPCAAGLKLGRQPEDRPAAIALTIADLTRSPEDEFDIPYEIAMARGDFEADDRDDPTGQLLASSRQKEQSAQCMPKNRAKVAENFLLTFERDYKSRFATGLRNLKVPAFLTVGDWRFKEMLRNFLVHAHGLACTSSDHILVAHVGLDRKSYEECKALATGIVQPANVGSKGKFDLRCIDLSGWLPEALFEEKAAQSWSCAYNMLLWTKPHIIAAAVEASAQPVMMIDTDVILHKNVVRLAQEVLARCDGCSVVSGREHSSVHKQNTGTVYSDKAGLSVLKEWARLDPEFLNAKEGDQSAMQSLMATNRTMRKQLAVFQLEDVGECGIPGSYATHYNCLTGKKVNMIRQGHWDTRVYREPAQLRCREPGEPVEVLQDTGATKGSKNLAMPSRKRIIGGEKVGEAAGAQKLSFEKATTSCSSFACQAHPPSQAIDGFVNTVAGVNLRGTWQGDLGGVKQVVRVEVTFESCMCKARDSMLLEASKDNATWTGYGSISDLVVWEGTRSVAFERQLNARYLRLRPAAWYSSAPRRGDEWFAVREVEAFGLRELAQEQPQPARRPTWRERIERVRRGRRERRRRRERIERRQRRRFLGLL